MEHIFVNLKRFDIPKALGGVNQLAPAKTWAKYIVDKVQEKLRAYDEDEMEFVFFFPEAHLIPAAEARSVDSPVILGCQGVYREDVAAEGNFGAYTSNRPASAAAGLGCGWALIGHCEERMDKMGILAEAGVKDALAVNRILNQEVRAAQKAGLKVLYCVGERMEEQERWQQVLKDQLTLGLKDVDLERIVLAYEPVWSIGPGKSPADKGYITKIACFLKECVGNVDVVYGGGLKKDNASMLASIPEINGGLIALTRFSGEIGFYPEEYLEIVSMYYSGREQV